MNRLVLALIALAAVGAAAWLLLKTPTTETVPVDGEGGAIEEAVAPEAATGPGLAATTVGHRRTAAGDSHRGGGAIVGTVRRAGKTVAARVEVTFVSEPNPFASSRRGGMVAFFQRMLTPPTGGEKPVASAQAGDDGKFVVEGVGAGIYDVTAITPDGARGVATAAIPVDGARVEANPVVSAGSETLNGRVVHADGKPWKGVVVVDARGLQNMGFDNSPRGLPMEVDAEGRFRATGLEPGSVTVNAFEGESFRATSRPVAIPRADEYVMTIDTAFVLVTGRVTAADDQSPISGAFVMSGGEGGELAMVATKTTSDAEGKFQLSMGTGARWGVFATATGFAGVLLQSVDPKVPLEIRMPRGARVSGRVSSEGDGRGIGGLSVNVQSLDRSGSPFSPPSSTTDADGKYTAVDLPALESMVVAEGSGWVTKGLRDVKPGGYNPLAVTLEAGKTVTMDVVVVRGCSASGTVLDAGGAPVAGAVVRANQGGPNAMRMRSFPFDAGGTTAATTADGTFAIEGLVSGATYDFTAEAPGHANATAGPMTAADAAPLKVELRFATDRWIDVTVLDDASGAAVPGVQVNVWSEAASRGGGGRGSSMPSLMTGADGKVHAGPVAPGAAQVSANVDGYIRAQQTRVAEADTAVTIRLKRGLALGGRVLNPDKTPAAGVSVRAEPIDYQNWNWVQPETTGADGSFRFKSLSAGKLTLRATQASSGPSLEASVAATAGGEDVVLVLASRSASSEEGGSLLVRVLDADGKPIPLAEARLATTNGSYGTNVRDGRVEFQRARTPPGGEAYVLVWNARSADGAPLPYGPTRFGPVAATASEAEMRLNPERRIEGVVKSPDGKPVRGVVVQATPVQQAGDRNTGRDWSGTSAPPARTDAGGAFRLSGLGDIDYTLTVKTPPEFAPAEPVTARGGATGVEIVLKAGTAARITVLDWIASPVAGVFVSVGPVRSNTPEENRVYPPGRGDGGASTPTDAEGVARLEGLDPSAEYRLQTQSPQNRTDLLPYVAERWKPGDTTIRLLRAFVVKGTVRDPGGRPVAGANVMRKSEGGGWQGSGATREDGAFVFNGLSAGDVVLQAAMEGHGIGQGVTVTVQAGTENVVLTVDPGLDLAIRIDNWPSDAPQWQQASLRSTEGQGISLSRQIAPDGTAKFRGLTADATYTLWVPPVGDGLSLLDRGLKAGRSEQHVRLVAGKTISGRIIVPAGASVQSVNASLKDGAANVQGVVKPDGTYELRGLPDGTWNVNAWGRSGDAGITGRADVVAGGTADIELKAQSR